MQEAFVIQVAYFAAARELAGLAEERVSLRAAQLTVAELARELAARHAALSNVIHRMRMAVNGELVHDGALVRAGDRVDVLPPVAGGSSAAACRISDAPLSIDEIVSALRAPSVGGIALFVGTVRDHADGKPVARLDYESHPTMAERELRAVLAEVQAAHPEARLAAVHRTGQLAVGELAIVVGAAAPHRAQAFEACRQAVEEIKRRVPIWKKEWAPDGSANWVNL